MCTENGERTRACTRCDETETEVIPALGHAYDKTVTAPTCTENGCTTYICARCDDRYTENITTALGHDFGEWTITKPATTDEEGEEMRNCSRCDEIQTRVIDKLPKLPAFSLDGESAYPGGTVRVIIRVDQNPGIATALLRLSYDRNVLTLTKVENGFVFADDDFMQGGNLSAVPFTLLWADALSPRNNTQNGILAILTFTVSEDAPAGNTPVTITYDTDSTLDVNTNPVAFTIQSGAVDVLARVSGDVDGNRIINLRDVVYLRRYLADWDVQITSVNADVDADGAHTLADVVLLTRYIAGGWGVVLR